jgi:hypothetical protein
MELPCHVYPANTLRLIITIAINITQAIAVSAGNKTVVIE